jgi:ABC-type transport system involved in multi-copper enzyme maturation permease subunit
MEMKRLRKNLIIALVAPIAYSALIMVFYIAFAGVFEDMSGLFENASLQGLLKAFSMDTNTFSYILSYYVAYNGVYMLIMGIIFSATIAVKLFSKEIRDGTYEFIYANPISRVKIFLSKSLVIVFYLVILNVLVFLVGFVSIELLKTKSPIIAWMDETNKELLIEKLDEDPSRINYFERDDALFYDVMFSSLEKQFTMADEVMDIDMEVANDLLSVFLMNPDGVFDELLAKPDKYMVLFEMGEGDEAAYLETIQGQKDNYFTVKGQFVNSDDVAIALFTANPIPFMDQLNADDVENFSSTFGLSEKESGNVFVYYSLKNFIALSWMTFLVMLTIALFVMMLVVVVPKGKMTSGMATGVCMLIYFLNMMSNIAEPVRFLRYFTPLSYINMDVMAIDYTTEPWSLIVIATTILVSYAVSIVSINKSDLLA